MRFKFFCLLTILFISGCSTYAVDRYSISADNVMALRTFNGQKISVGEFTSFKPDLKEITCRAVGPIKTPDGNTYADFIREALIDELQIAEIYSDKSPIILKGHLDNIEFSSSGGTWNLALTTTSSNGQSVSVSEEYKFTTSWYGETACNQTAQALVPATQNLLKKLITDPKFPELVK